MARFWLLSAPLNATQQAGVDTRFSSRQSVVLWVLWLTYGSFYFCRNNLSVALPGLEAELGYTKAQLGTLLMALKLSYGFGQFVNGQMAEHWRPRHLLALGLCASAALNVLFGFATGLYFLVFIWACNGYVQALGWPPTMRVAADWFPFTQRGRAIGIIGTGYQLCGALTFVVAGWAAGRFGWRGALYIPAVLLLLSAVHLVMMLEEAPGSAGDASQGRRGASAFAELRTNLKVTVTNPSLWLVAIALLLLDACRYGFTDWGVTHLKEVTKSSVSSAAFKYAVLPLGGMFGAYAAGWATDRFFGGRRAPVICALLLALGGLAMAYDHVVHWGLGASSVVLFAIGFCIFGPQVLLVGTLPVDLARRGTAAAAAGFVNFMGYMGAAAGDKLTGHLVQDHGWRFAVHFWAACALAGALVMTGLWRAGTKRQAVNG